MSAIDNAFIRAYTLDTASSSASASSAVQRPANGAVAPRRTPVVVAAESPAMVAVNSPSRSAVPSPHIRLASFVHTTTTLEPSPTIQNSSILEPPKPDLPAAEFDWPDAALITEELPALELSETEAGLPELDSTPLQLAPPTLPFSAAVAAKAESEPKGPSAAFEVDHFSWPDLCDTLLEKRSGDFDQLVGQLVTESALGRKVVAITGSRRGEGRTTLALALARRLAATAVKVVLVDADFEVPQLAARLGTTVQSGWENVLADGLPVWDGLVESLNDRLALLPLAPRPTNTAGHPIAAEFVTKHSDAIRQHLDALRKEFDVVLVDAGAVKAARPDAKPRGPLALAGSLDAAITVSDARTAVPGRIADLHRRLLEANIIPLGIAENFCPLKPD